MMRANYSMSTHAARRAQQRAIPREMVQVLVALGAENYQKGGTSKLYLTDDVVRTIRRVAKRLDSLKDSYLIMSDDGRVITTGHDYK